MAQHAQGESHTFANPLPTIYGRTIYACACGEVATVPSAGHTQNVSRETLPEWVRRAQAGRLVAKDMTR